MSEADPVAGVDELEVEDDVESVLPNRSELDDEEAEVLLVPDV